jgi:GTP-binding protein
LSLKRKDIRNIAVIAHVDHGKTTLVDAILRDSGVFRKNELVPELVMDSNAIERERGITIFSKSAAFHYKGVKVNLVDTPGHADFGGEVERILSLVDGCLLLVDAVDGPMPQTRFVLKKALAAKLKPIVVINKIDRPEARPEAVLEAIYELFLELGTEDLDLPVIYTDAKRGIAKRRLDEKSKNVLPLLNAILEHVPPPPGDSKKPLQMLVATIDYNDYVGRMGMGRIRQGRVAMDEVVSLIHLNGEIESGKVTRLLINEGLEKVEVKEASAGEIVTLAGFPDIQIGETLADAASPKALPVIAVEEPTIAMIFSVNDSPLAGREGKYLTSRHLKDRLDRELRSDLALRVEPTETPNAFKVSGRGELHLSILIEKMRREGYEVAVGKPEVIYKTSHGVRLEPVESLSIDIPEEFMGTILERLGPRKAEMANMTRDGKGRVLLEFRIPSRGLLGFENDFLTETRGTGQIHHYFLEYEPDKGPIEVKRNGVLVALESGVATSYALDTLQERGALFISPGAKVYEGMIVGENAKDLDIVVNPCKEKRLTNIRSSTAEEAIRLTPPRILTLEGALEFLAEDELLEVTPQSLRLRKKLLSETGRKRASRPGRE